jgi:demethylmenaquinone methyltransferase/2-methoxy-6-polyprenyl-1,4-benzoquinol methylase
MRATPDKDPRKIVTMFSELSGRYDLMNALMSFGAHQRWRLKAARDLAARASRPVSLLDYGAGTGDFARAALQQIPSLTVLVLQDGSDEMLALARSKLSVESGHRKVEFVKADAGALPFADASFDLVTAGFILRNVPDIGQSLKEIARVLKPGGLLAVVEAFREHGALAAPVRFYKRCVIPLIARLVVGPTSAFQYLNDSIDGLIAPEELARLMEQHGFQVDLLQRVSIGFVYELIARKENGK